MYRIVIDFDYADEEDIDDIYTRISEAVMSIIDPNCDGTLPCPRDWKMEGLIVVNT